MMDDNACKYFQNARALFMLKGSSSLQVRHCPHQSVLPASSDGRLPLSCCSRKFLVAGACMVFACGPHARGWC